MDPMVGDYVRFKHKRVVIIGTLLCGSYAARARADIALFGE